jgi:subtilisin-like proprotein convertase family protein
MSDGQLTATSTVTLVITPVNDAPTISTMPNTEVVSGNTTTNITFTVSDLETDAGSLAVTATSSNTGLVPNSNIVLGGSGGSRFLTVTPIGAGTGTTTIAVVVSDGSLTATNSFVLTVTSSPEQRFANTTAITIRDSTNALAYPSVINVFGLTNASGVPFKVYSASVVLDGFSHGSPQNVDVLLVGPQGQSVVLLSDVGGTSPVSNLRLRFADTGATVPTDGPLDSTTYRPSNVDTRDTFNAPAPAGPYGDTLGVFTGTDPNGDWKLYIMDDTALSSGDIARGWTLAIVTAPSLILSTPAPGVTLVSPEDTAATVTYSIGDLTAAPSALELRYINSNTGLFPAGSVAFNVGSLPSVTATATPAPDAFGTNNLTLIVRRSDGAQTSVVVPMNVTNVNDAPTVSRLTQKVTDEDTPLSINFRISDIDTVITNLAIRAFSGNTTVISDTNLLFFGATNYLAHLPEADVKFTMVPNANQSASAVINIVISDTNGVAPSFVVTTNFTLVVNPINDPPTISSIGPQVAIGTNTTPPIGFTVGDLDSATVTITATSSDQAVVKNASIVVNTPSGAPGARTVQITPERVTNQATTTITLTVSDGWLTASTSFVLSVQPPRDSTYANTQAITIRDNTTADPYPSTINVSGLVGNVAKVKVTLNGFTHRFPDDVDLLLVGPAGQKMILMSDAGGGNSVTNLTLTFDDAAADSLPDNARIDPVTYKPSNYDAVTDPFPGGAPAGPYAAALSVFNNTSPNGTWSLYVVDDSPSDSGAIQGGWSLTITTQPILTGLADLTTPEDTATNQTFTIAEESFVTASFSLGGTSTNTALVANTNITFSGGGTTWTVSVMPTLNAFGQTEITVRATNAYQQVVSDTFILVVTPVNDPPSITAVADQTILAGTFAEVNFDYSDPETAKGSLLLNIESSNPALIPPGNVVLGGGKMTVTPIGNLSGTADITITVTDNDPVPLTSTETFTVQVQPDPSVFAAAAPIVINDFAAATPYPSTISVSGLSANVAKVTVTLLGLTHAFPDDIDVLLVGPQGQTVVLMSDAGRNGSLSSARLTFDDASTNSLPDSGGIASGVYKPANYVAPDAFVAPAPGEPYGTTLSVFNGGNPNGDWSLYVMDDTTGGLGLISGGWLLRVVTTAPVIPAIATQITPEDTPITVPFSVNDIDTNPTNLVVTATSSGDPTNLVASLVVGGPITNRTVRITPTANLFGTNVVQLSVTDGTSTTVTSFTLIVTSVDDAPIIAGLVDSSVEANRTLVVEFTVDDLDTLAKELVVSATVLDPGLGTATVAGTNNVYSLTFVPSGTVGQTNIEVVAFDGELSTTNFFAVTIIAPIPPTISAITTPQITPEDTPLTVAFTVVSGDPTNLVVAAHADNAQLVAGTQVQPGANGYNLLITLVTNANSAQFTNVTTITVEATDTVGTGSTNFVLTVTPVDDPPTLGAIADQTTTNVFVVVPLQVADPDDALSKLTFSSSTSNPDLVTNITFNVTGTNVVATVGVVVVDSPEFGVVTIAVGDASSTVSRSFALLVNPPPEVLPAITSFGLIPGTQVLRIEWTGGTLQTAPNVTGPWTDLTGVGSPLQQPATGPSKFYRVKQ